MDKKMNKKNPKKIVKFEEFDDLLGQEIKSELPIKVTKEFWDFVEKMKWKEYSRSKENKRRNMERGDKFLLENIAPYYSWEEFSEFKDIYQSLLNYLGEKYKETWLEDPGIEVSDDSWWDLRSSAIGYGKEHFMNILSDEQVLVKQGNTFDFAENFGYVFQELDNENLKEKWDKIYNENNKKN